MSQFDNVVPIWGIQRMKELSEWLSYMENPPEPDENFADFAKREKEVLTGDFCRGCSYCMPCPQGISINDCARMSLMVRRAPTAAWVSEHWQNEMKKIENCTGCGRCASKCPYSLDTSGLLRKNYEDYKSNKMARVRRSVDSESFYICDCLFQPLLYPAHNKVRLERQ